MTVITPKSPLDILTVTRKIFAASHWTAGTYTGMSFEDILDEDLEEGKKVGKPVGCAVGGLRYAALAPLEHALDETWMFVNFNALGGESINATEEIAESYLTAIEFLLQAIDGEWEEDNYGSRFERSVDLWENISRVEDRIVAWNDSRGYDPEEGRDEAERLEVVNRDLLPTFDRAIALATAAQAQADQAENPTEGS